MTDKKRRRRKIEARQPKPIKEQPMRPIRTCDCGHPRRKGIFHTAVGCWEEE
jgi:hypothetical protein